MDIEKGRLIATFPDGTKIFENGLVNWKGYIETTIGIYNFSSEFNPNTGEWESIAVLLALPIGEKLEFQPDGDAMEVTVGGSIPIAGPATLDLAVIVGPNGDVSYSIGAGLGAELGGIGLSAGAGFGFSEGSSRGFSRLDTITVSPNGDIYETKYYPASKSDDGMFDYKITARINHYDGTGKLLRRYKSGITDPKLAVDMVAGIKSRRKRAIPKVKRHRPTNEKIQSRDGSESHNSVAIGPPQIDDNAPFAAGPQDTDSLLEERYESDSEIIREFHRMSAPEPQSVLDPFAENDPVRLSDDGLPVSATEISGTGSVTNHRQRHNNQHRLEDLVQPAVFRRSNSAPEPTPQNEPFSGLVSNEIVEALPGVGDALERRSKVLSAQFEMRTNNEQSPAAPPTPRPRPKLNPITEGFLKDMPDDGRLVLVAEMAGLKGQKDTDKAEAERLARFDVQRKKAQDLEDIKAGKLSTVWDQYGHPKAVRDLLGEEDYQNFVDDRLEAGLIFHATAGLHLLQDKDLFGIGEGTTQLEAPHDKLAELMTPKVMAAAAERARDILTLRKKKPSEAVLLSSELAKRKEAFDAAFEANEPVDTEEMDRFLFYFEAAQKEIGVAEPAIEIVPPNWASQVAEQFQMPDTGNGAPTDRREHKAAFKQQYSDMQNTFGRRTDDVVAYSLARSASNGL